MALPTSGPFRTLRDTEAEYVDVYKYKQKRPFNLALPYTASHGKLVSKNGSFTFSARSPFSKGFDWSKERAQCENLAYERFKGAVSDRASMGENLGQLGSSARLIAEQAGVVLESLRRLRRLDVSAFAQWMSRGFVKRNSRFAAAKTLEINFAIAPAISDIFSAVEILQSPVKDSIVRGRAHVPFSGFRSMPQYTNVMSAVVSVEIGAMIEVTNPNLHLADAMGLINPAQIVWQLLPGSFLLDWFIPVELFLGAATDFCGLTLTRSYSTVCMRNGYFTETWIPYPWSGSSKFHYMERKLGIITPNLSLRPLKNPSLKRAANAVALLVQAFYK